MSGIIFFKTQTLDTLKDFYKGRIGCDLWLDQGGCVIFRHGNLLLGFCQGDRAETQGVITFFYPDRKGVDSMFSGFEDSADGPPRRNETYRIYQFFARDPEGRTLEFQSFEHPLPD